MASKDTEEAVKEATEGPDVIEAESDGENSDNFEDASDSAGGGIHDFDRPEEWGECSDEVGGCELGQTEVIAVLPLLLLPQVTSSPFSCFSHNFLYM